MAVGQRPGFSTNKSTGALKGQNNETPYVAIPRQDSDPFGFSTKNRQPILANEIRDEQHRYIPTGPEDAVVGAPTQMNLLQKLTSNKSVYEIKELPATQEG